MKVAVYGRKIETKEFRAFYQKFVDLLNEYTIAYDFVSDYGAFLKSTYGFDGDHCQSKDLTPANYTCVISLGGDGTALDTLMLVKDSGLPVMGINLGRLGFLANIKVDEIEQAIAALKNNKTRVQNKSILHVESDLEEMQEFPYALNDFVVQKRDTSAMITVKATLDGDVLNTYWADGLIVSTPTGSSGYSLSCGGPLIFPGSKSFVITPIAAHNLTVRPAIIPDDSVLEIETSGRSDTVLITLDSRSFIVPAHAKLKIKRAPFDFKMLQLEGTTYMDTLRDKLLWGADRREGV